MSAPSSGGESGKIACSPDQDQVISSGPSGSDGGMNTTYSQRLGLWDLPSAVRGRRDPDLGSRLGSVYNLFCDSEEDVHFLQGLHFP